MSISSRSLAALSLSALLLSPIANATPKVPQGISRSSAATPAQASFARLSHQFIEALWRLDPESALAAGRYEFAGKLALPDAESRTAQLRFTDEWLSRFRALDASQLSVAQRTDLGLLLNKLESDRWYLSEFRAFEWDPSQYNVAGSLDLILNTEYAPKPRRLRALLQRLAGVPAYYQAAQANLRQVTHEHTALAIKQAPGTLAVLDELDSAAKSSMLSQREKTEFAQRVGQARAAVKGYVDFLTALDERQTREGKARSFRIGRELYEAKFRYDIQSGSNAEQTYQKALAAREQLLQKMDQLADELWPRTMGDAAKPSDRTEKIGRVIDKLSVNHVKREDFFNEIRRQIPVLQDWVVKHDLLGLDASKPLVVRETPVYARGVAGAGIQPPGPYRPQDKTYYDVTPFDGASDEQAESTLREYNHWILQILNIHEAIPGHYTQLVYANRSPSLVKSLFGNGAMIEGWAVYGERMMLESGYGDNAPEMWLMYCKWNLRSVTNTILDYSVHVLGISEAEATDLLTRQAFQTQQEAREKWHRAQVSSVQLASYFSGYSEIMELREERKKALGDKFKLKDFHEQFLSYGSAPVRVIRELMSH